MIHKLLFTLFITTVGFSNLLAQQLPYWSVFSDRGFIWNPAMTASWEYLEVGLNYRQQWVGFEDAPRTASISGQFPLINNNMSIGGFFMNDQVGNFNANRLALTYAYKLSFGRNAQLAIGVKGDFNRFTYTAYNLIINDIDDELLIEGENSKLLPNVGAGLYFTSRSGVDYEESHFFVGVAMNDIIPKELIFSELNSATAFSQTQHFNAIIGGRINMQQQNHNYFQPSIFFDYSLNQAFLGILSLKLGRDKLGWLGGIFSSDKSVGIQGALSLGEDGGLEIGGLMIRNIGKLGKYQQLGFEVLIAYKY